VRGRLRALSGGRGRALDSCRLCGSGLECGVRRRHRPLGLSQLASLSTHTGAAINVGCVCANKSVRSIRLVMAASRTL
jgi:hypothetical protein